MSVGIKIKAKRKYRGFSLMEMLVTIFVFSLVMTSAMAVFVTIVNARKKAKAIQRDMEDVRFTMEQMAKTLRTSTIFTADGNSTIIRAYENSQGRCVQYRLFGNRLQTGSGSAILDANNHATSCSTGSWSNMTEASVSDLEFFITKSNNAVNPRVVGKVTVMMKVCYKNVCSAGTDGDQAIIQTTVSLRDYASTN